MQKFVPVGFGLPQTFTEPFQSCSLFDPSQFSEANGATSLQVSDDFASLSSLLNLLEKISTSEVSFLSFPPIHSAGTVTGLDASGWTWGFSTSLFPSDCVYFALREV